LSFQTSWVCGGPNLADGDATELHRLGSGILRIKTRERRVMILARRGELSRFLAYCLGASCILIASCNRCAIAGAWL
jgi:hypothetical protein